MQFGSQLEEIWSRIKWEFIQRSRLQFTSRIYIYIFLFKAMSFSSELNLRIFQI